MKIVIDTYDGGKELTLEEVCVAARTMRIKAALTCEEPAGKLVNFIADQLVRQARDMAALELGR